MRKEPELVERTFLFGVKTGQLFYKYPFNPVLAIYIRQLIRSSSSIGANYEEAQAGESKRDFIHKVGIALKEARESYYWLKVLHAFLHSTEIEPQLNLLKTEAQELKNILATIIKKAKENA